MENGTTTYYCCVRTVVVVLLFVVCCSHTSHTVPDADSFGRAGSLSLGTGRPPRTPPTLFVCVAVREK